MSRRGRHAALAGLLLSVALPPLAAQPALTLTPRSTDAFVGEALELVLEIRDFRTAEAPVPPEVPGATLRQIGDKFESSQVTIVNGRRTESHTRTYTFELLAQAPGELTLPPFRVEVDGQALQTRPVQITVRPSDVSSLFFVEISAGAQRIFVGQRVQVTMSIWIKPPRWGNQVVALSQMLRQIRPIDFGPFPLQVSQHETRARDEGEPASERYYVYAFTATFIAEHPGPLEFSEVEVGLDYPTPRGTRRLRARPQVAAAEVLPVPMDGRPANFNGAVGLLEIQTAASPTSVRVGDPINLTIDVFGDGPLETLAPPLLAANAELTESFRLPTEQLAGEVHEAKRRFTLTIRPRHDSVTAIPVIEYPYFDPTAERFVIARSDPIPLAVAPAAEVAAPPSPSVGPTPDPAELEALDGLRDIETRTAALLAAATPVAPRAVVLAAVAPAGAFLLAWAGLAWRQAQVADPSGRRRRAALRTAARRLARARQAAPHQVAVEIRAALAGYLADRFGQPAARLAGPAAVEFLRQRGAAAGVVTEWETLTVRCDEAAFAGGTDGVSEALCEQARRCLAVTERQMR